MTRQEKPEGVYKFTSATADSNGLFLLVFEVIAIFVLYCITADYGINQFRLKNITMRIHENKHGIHFYATDSNRFTLPHAGVLVARAGGKTPPDIAPKYLYCSKVT